MMNAPSPSTLDARNSHRLGVLLVTASAVAWSTAGLFTRAIPLDVATLLVWRGLFGGLGVLAVIVLLDGRKGLLGFRKLGWAGVLLVLVSASGMACFIASLRHTTVAHVAIVYATVPFIAAALAWLVMRERPSTGAVQASLVALGGVAMMVGLGGDGGWFGDLLALGMTLSMAAVIVISRYVPGIPTLAAACLSALLSAAMAVLFSSALAPSPNDLLLLALFGLVNSALGMALFVRGSRTLPAIETALIGSLDAPLAPIWVWLMFHETPNPVTLAGGAIVFIAVIAHILREARSHTKPQKY